MATFSFLRTLIKKQLTRMAKRLLLSALMLAFCSSIWAQDLHYTNYAAAPQILNPAKIGDFLGTFKVGAIYRDQFSSFFNQGFKSQGVFAEANLPIGFKAHHWVSFGLALDTDTSGDLSFGTTRVTGTGAYHLALDKKYKNIFSVGVQYGMITRRSDPTALRTNTTLTGATTDPDQQLLQLYDNSGADVNVGVKFESQLNKRTRFELGTGFYHFLASRTSNTSSGIATGDLIPFRVNVHTSLDHQFNKKVSLEPRIVYSRADNATDLSLQFVTSYQFPKSEFDLGLGYRVGDALEFILGYHFNGWHAFGAYDMTVSSASEFNNNVGGFEIGVYKILVKHPKAKVETKQICPRL